MYYILFKNFSATSASNGSLSNWVENKSIFCSWGLKNWHWHLLIKCFKNWSFQKMLITKNMPLIWMPPYLCAGGEIRIVRVLFTIGITQIIIGRTVGYILRTFVETIFYTVGAFWRHLLLDVPHHSKMQKDGKAKYITNFGFKWCPSDLISTSTSFF